MRKNDAVSDCLDEGIFHYIHYVQDVWLFIFLNPVETRLKSGVMWPFILTHTLRLSHVQLHVRFLEDN